MADVQVQQTPDGGGSGVAWAVGVIALVLLVVILWFVFAERGAEAREETNIDLEVPQTTTQIEVPERIEVDLPEKIDINIGTQTQPPAQPPTQTNT